MSSPDDKLIEEALRHFFNELHAVLPLRHFGEFHDLDEKQLNEVIEQRRMIVFKNVFAKIWSRDKEEIVSLFMKLNGRVNKEVIAERTKKNSEHRIQSVSFLQKRIEAISDDFKVALEDQLDLDPDMELESFKNYIDSRKLFAASCFEGMWKPKNLKIVGERKAKLEKHLNSTAEEVLERQKLQLERKAVGERKDLLQEVERIVLERSRQLKSYVDNHQGRVSSQVLKGMVDDIKEYLVNGKGCALKESSEEIHSKLVKTLDGEIKFLSEQESSGSALSPDDMIRWAKRFAGMLESGCFNRMEVDEVQPELDSNMQAQWITIQQVLKEEPFDFRVPEEQEPDHRNVKSHTSSRNKRARVSGTASASEGAKRRLSLRLMTFNKDTNSNTHPKATAPGTATPQVSRPKRLKTGNGLSKKSDAYLASPDTAEVSASAKGILKRKLGRSLRNPNGVMKKGRSPFECNVCKKTFRNRQHFLKYHGEFCGIRADKPFVCKECGHGFSGKFQLEEHLRIHTGEKPFKCPKCSVRFTRKRHLNGHLLSHARGTPFICKACNLSFVSNHGLHDHNLTHLGKLPFACSYCDKRFQNMDQLKLHVVVHSDERPFKCPSCDSSFAAKKGLSSHVHRLHNQSKEVALKLANQAAAAYFARETNKSYSAVPFTKINSLVIAHVIRKAKLQLPSEIAETTAGVSLDL